MDPVTTTVVGGVIVLFSVVVLCVGLFKLLWREP